MKNVRTDVRDLMVHNHSVHYSTDAHIPDMLIFGQVKTTQLTVLCYEKRTESLSIVKRDVKHNFKEYGYGFPLKIIKKQLLVFTLTAIILFTQGTMSKLVISIHSR